MKKNCVMCQRSTICNTYDKLHSVLIKSEMFTSNGIESIFRRIASKCERYSNSGGINNGRHKGNKEPADS